MYGMRCLPLQPTHCSVTVMPPSPHTLHLAFTHMHAYLAVAVVNCQYQLLEEPPAKAHTCRRQTLLSRWLGGCIGWQVLQGLLCATALLCDLPLHKALPGSPAAHPMLSAAQQRISLQPLAHRASGSRSLLRVCTYVNKLPPDA